MLTHRLLSILLVGAVLISARCYAQVSVSGTVFDENGEALASASVVMTIDRSGLERYGSIADAEGAFLFRDVNPGRYSLVVSFIGYGSHSESIVIRDTSVADLRIVLLPSAIPQTGVVVSAHRVRVQLNPVTVSNISEDQLEDMPEMKDLPVILARTPSVTFHSENGNGIGYSTLRMRGFDQRRLAISINGIPQNDPEEFNVFWVNFFDVQGAVDDIQVQRGAGSSFYGPVAIGGAVNIRAFPYRAQPYARTELGYGAFNTRRASVELNSGLLANKYIVFARMSRLLSDGYRDWSWTEFWRFFAGLTRYGKKSTITLQAYGGPQQDGLAYSGIPKGANSESIIDEFGTEIDRKYNFSSFDRDVERFHQPHLELHHTLQISEGAEFNQSVFWVKGEGYFDFGGTFRSAEYLRLPADFVPPEDRLLPLFLSRPDVSVLFRAYLDQWQVGWLPSVEFNREKWTARLGAELRLHRSLRWGRIQKSDGIPEGLVGGTNDVRVYSFRGEKAIASIAGTSLFRPSGKWAIQGDVQLTYRAYRIYDEAFSETRFHVPYVFLNPRIGVTFNPEQPVSAYVSLAVANREPRMKTLYDGEEAGAGMSPAFEIGPDDGFDYDRPLVTPEQLVDLELGTTLKGKSHSATANFFFMGFRNEIVPSGGLDQFGVPRTGNAKRSRHVGVELDLSVEALRSFTIGGTLTLSRNRFVSFTEYVFQPDNTSIPVSRNNNPIAGFPDVSANFDITYRRGGWMANIHLSYVGEQHIDNSGSRLPDGTLSDALMVDPFSLLDASVRYEFPSDSPFEGFRIGVDVNNVFDEKVLAFGNVSVTGPQFFPHATRHVFFSLAFIMR